MKSVYGTLTGGGTVDAISISSISPPATWAVVRIRAGSGTASYALDYNGRPGARVTVATVDQANTWPLDAVGPQWPHKLNGATYLNVSMVSASALAYVVIVGDDSDVAP